MVNELKEHYTLGYFSYMKLYNVNKHEAENKPLKALKNFSKTVRNNNR